MIMEHRYTYPKVTELRDPRPPVRSVRAQSQRELVAASLIRCPSPVGASPGR